MPDEKVIGSISKKTYREAAELAKNNPGDFADQTFDIFYFIKKEQAELKNQIPTCEECNKKFLTKSQAGLVGSIIVGTLSAFWWVLEKIGKINIIE